MTSVSPTRRDVTRRSRGISPSRAGIDLLNYCCQHDTASQILPTDLSHSAAKPPGAHHGKKERRAHHIWRPSWW